MATLGGGNVQLQVLALDGLTWIRAPITAASMITNDLPPGQYRIAVTTATAVYAALTSVPL